MGSNTKLYADDKGDKVDPKLYRSMIGSLLYLTASRPDIMYAVCVCARFQANPNETHLKSVKRIVRYIKGTSGYGLYYPRSSSFDLLGYSDADFTGSQRIERALVALVNF